MQGNWDPAERAFCRAIREPDAGPTTRLELAQALLFRRDSSAAAKWAEEVSTQDPGNTRARELLGDALVRLGRSDEACSAWLFASKLPITSMGQRDFEEAEQAAKQLDFARAERFYRRVAGCQPNHALAHAKLAATLTKLGQQNAARHWARRALDLAPEDLAVRAAIPAALR
jgi:Flp pilus assembly protein TadD